MPLMGYCENKHYQPSLKTCSTISETTLCKIGSDKSSFGLHKNKNTMVESQLFDLECNRKSDDIFPISYTDKLKSKRQIDFIKKIGK